MTYQNKHVLYTIIFLLALSIIFHNIPPITFDNKNQNTNPHTTIRHDSIPYSYVIFLYVILPLGIFSTINYTKKEARISYKTIILYFLLSQVIILFITNFLKITIGRNRPDIHARWSNDNKKLVVDGQKSFPSGHAATAFCGGVYNMLFCFDYSTSNLYYFFVTIVLCFLYIMGSACIAVSRIIDLKHHLSDVVFGSILGVIVAYVVYKNFQKKIKEEENSNQQIAR